MIHVGSRPAARCPACGSEKVTNRRGRFWLIVAIMVVAGATLVIDGLVDGWGWVVVAGMVGAAFVAVLNALAAIAAPWKCETCKGVWRERGTS